MAEVNEYFGSGIGDRWGLDGARATKLYQVILDKTQVDSYTHKVDNEDDPITPVAERFKIGMPHPTPGFSYLTVSSYDVVERDENRPERYLVQVTYENPWDQASPFLQGWDIKVTAASETDELVRDLDGIPVGGHAYRVPKELPGGGTESPTHYAITVNGRQDLVQIDTNDLIIPRGVDYQRGVSGLVMTGTSLRMSDSVVAAARRFRGKVNSGTFFGSSKHHLLFDTLEVASRPADAQVQAQTNKKVVYEINLTFVHSEGEPFTPVELTDTYTDDSGFESLVRDLSGNVVVRRFKRYYPDNFYNLLRVFGTTTLTNLDGAIIQVGP